jgi:5'-methylthioadenosine phosphorylase
MIGVFGGSGFYDFLDDPREVKVETPYGDPAAPFLLAEIDGTDVAFLPRHGREHQFPAHLVPFRANVWGMRELGVTTVIGPCAVGSLQREYAPGSFVVCDQLVDWTKGRTGTFFDGPEVTHLSFADPYTAELRTIAIRSLQDAGATVHDGGTVVVIEGPRFSTRAESAFFSAQGWSVINMTQAPEAQLCRELDMGYVNVSVVTDYDVGVAGSIAPVTHDEVLRQFAASIDTLRAAVWRMVPAMAASPPAPSS